METRRIGSLEVSVVGLGCNSFGTVFGTPVDEAGTRAVVDAAIDHGVTFLDTADVYGDSEEFLGRILEGRRDQVVLATKFGSRLGGDEAKRGGSARWITEAVEGSLRRLRTDHIDLYQFHMPDADTPIEETLTALDALVRAGKVRELGCSNFSGAQIDEAAAVAEANGLHPFASVQNELSILRSKGFDDAGAACQRHGMGFVPYSPLASGLLSGKYSGDQVPDKGTRFGNLPEDLRARSLSERNLGRVRALSGFAAQRGHTVLELAIAWLLAHPVVASVIAGATRPEQVAANAAAASWQLSEEEVVAAAAAAAG